MYPDWQLSFPNAHNFQCTLDFPTRSINCQEEGKKKEQMYTFKK